MACRPVVDFPAVVTALENLKKLEHELKEEGIRPEISLHLMHVSSAVTELEENRRAAHELLEVESIENSKLRHQCDHMTEWARQSMMADIAAARASNAEEIEQLHKHLLASAQLLEDTVKKQEVLQAQNDNLRPDRDQVQAQHHGAVVALNQAITQKYSSQKHLDKIKEDVGELQTLIAAVEQVKKTLQQNVALERDSFATHADDLSKEMVEVNKNIQVQRQETKSKRRQLVSVNEKKHKANKCLEELRTEMTKMENGLQRLAAFRGQCEKHLKDEIQMHQDQHTQRVSLKKDLCEMTEAFLITVHKLQQDTAAFEHKMEVGRASRIHLQDATAKICEVFKRQHEEETEERDKRSSTSKQLQKSKSQLEERIASIVQHRQEVQHMDKLITQLVETESINRHTFDRRREELNGNMDTEKKHLSQYEEEKKHLGALLEERKMKQEEHEVKMTVEISLMKRRCEELRQEVDALHQCHPLSRDLVLLRSHLIQCKADCQQRESRQREELEQCSAETERVTGSCEEMQRQVEEQEEVLKEVEAAWKEEMWKHQELEKRIREQMEKRSDLELLTQGLKENAMALLQRKEEKEEELEAARATRLELLDKQVSQVQRLGRSIFNSRVKVEQVGVENSRLKLHIQQMEEYVRTAGQDKDRYLQETQCLTDHTKALCDSGQDACRREQLLIQDRQSRDVHLMEVTDKLLDHLKRRSEQLRQASGQLQQDMSNFSRRLEGRRTEKKTTAGHVQL